MRLALHWKILIGLALGVVAGIALREWWPAAPDPTLARVGLVVGGIANLCADLFIRGLRFIAVPIVLFTLTTAVAGLGDVRRLGRIGGKTLALFVGQTIVAAALGLFLARVFQPGLAVPEELRSRLATERAGEVAQRVDQAAALSVWDQLRAIVPTNPFESLARGDMLQVVFLALVLGIGLAYLPAERAKPALAAFDALGDAILVLVRLLMHAAPAAVFVLIARVTYQLGYDLLLALLQYCVVVLGGIVLLLTVLYPVMLAMLQRGPRRIGVMQFTRAFAPAQLLAFSSSSSAATLPVTMECVRDRLGVKEDIAGFVLPLGVTINMAGTALYQAVAALFIAQMYGIELDLGRQIALVLLATLIAIGTPGVPGASVALLAVVLQTIRVPTEGIAVIVAVDRVLDMARTVANVTGDAVTAAIVASGENAIGVPSDPEVTS